jgi:hypothetical protein
LWRKIQTEVAILERGADVLQKLEFPAVEDATSRTLFFEPNELVKFYPRGEKRTTRTFSSVLLWRHD